ncbi:hypothetical protein PQQ96_05950 [Paraburkholderia sediminicola]|uniref:hypothetical protein n=1 Tax=Paraburkholderia sediminicola TaxID=458836 RepID=UPI0038BA612A
MSIKAAIEALAHNATHPKFIIDALHEIEARLKALEENAKRAAPVEGEAAATRPAIVALTPAPTPESAPAAVEPAAPVAPAVPEVAPAAPAVPPVTA